VRRGRNQVAFANLVDAPQPRSPRPARFADMGEAPLDPLAA
jgi:hypothetical protein